MSRMLVRAAAAVAAAATTAVALAGCHFAQPPPAAKAKPTVRYSTNPAAVRLADAPALVVQCAIRDAGLRPDGQSWFSGGKVSINSSTATDFDTWWRGHDSPGPYAQTFTVDGHRTHYLAFGAHWVNKNGAWVPEHRARTDPMAERTSLYAWALWAAANDKLPPAVCGTTQSATALQVQVFGKSSQDPWGA